MSDPDTALEAIGMAALDAFITTFNSRDPDAWAASLSYPHVRVAPRPGATVVSATEADYATETTYEAADAMGWDHSEWDAKTVLAVSPDRIHASAQWCRYDASGQRILVNNVSYVITEVDGRWGIQARFGVDSPPPTDPDATATWPRPSWPRCWRRCRPSDSMLSSATSACRSWSSVWDRSPTPHRPPMSSQRCAPSPTRRVRRRSPHSRSGRAV